MGTPSLLLERESELDQIAAALRSARKGRGRLLLIEGPAGIGKTRLLDEIRRGAARRRMTVLAARGGELERTFSYGIVRQLFEAPVQRAGREEQERLLAGAASLAGPVVAGSDPEPGVVGDATMPVLHGLYWLVANLATESPLALVIDDAHFADPASLRWLSFVAPRMDGVPLLTAVAVRSGEPGPHTEVIAALAAHPETQVLRPAPLSAAAVAHVVRGTLSEDASGQLCEACFRATAGNPFLIRELLSDIAARAGGAPTSPEQVAQLPPDAVSRAVLVRLGRLPRAAAALAKAVAVLGDGAEVRHAAALAELELEAAEDAADLLARADVLSPARPLSFVHPIVRAAIEQELGPGGRAVGHARAAKLLEADGAPAHDLAPHLLSTDPRGDAWVVDQLRAAAEWSRARGAPENAVDYLERALREPPPTAERPLVLFELGRAENLIRARCSIEHLQDAVRTARTDRARAEASLALALAFFHDGRLPETVRVLEQAVSECKDVDGDLARRLESDLISFGLFDTAARQRVSERLRRHAETGADDALALATLSFDGYLTARPAKEVVGQAEAALAGDRLLHLATGERPGFFFAVSALVFADRYDLALPAVSCGLIEASRHGAVAGIALCLTFQAITEYRQGRLAEAEADARSALEVEGSWAPMALATIVDVLLEHDDLDGARAVFERNPTAASPPGNLALHMPFHRRGLLLLAEGEPEAALAEFLDAGRREREWGVSNPSVLPWRSSAALAYMALGRAAEARELADEELALARQFGAPRPIGVALRAGALAEPQQRGIEMLEEAARILEPSGASLEYARTLIELGAALRRQGRRLDARDPLRNGFEFAHRCGAVPLADRARHELRASGIRVRRPTLTGPDALTPSERRVADLVASGASNREAAQALFVTEKTVETHLASAYRKLSIRSRRELAAKLSVASVAESASVPAPVVGP